MKRFFNLKGILALLILTGFFMVSPTEAKTLKQPKQISPKNKSHFTHFPRKVTLRWTEVKNALYDLEIDCMHCRQQNKWDSQTGQAWKVVKGLKASHFSFVFVGDNPGRWRVRARKGLLKSNWSSWWYFDFKTGSSNAEKPDLTVSRIRLINKCIIQVTLKNIGKGSVPESAYKGPQAVSIQMYNDEKPWGGLILDGFDKNRKLKKPGGSVTWRWFHQASNLKLGGGKHKITVMVDHHKKLVESNENNNQLTRVLECNQSPSIIGTEALAFNKIDKIRFSPVSPKTMNYNQDVKVAFGYTTSEKKGVYIFARPMTNGQLTPNYSAHPSPLYTGKGSGKGHFTITKGGPVTVDAVRFQMTDKTKKKVLFEKIVKVKYSFPALSAIAPGSIADTAGPAVNRVFLDFKNTRLVYNWKTGSIQISEGNKVLSYTQDWQKCNLGKSIVHMKEKFWSGFYWEINLATRKVYRVTNGTFCKGSGKKQPLDIQVNRSGDMITLRLKSAYLVYTTQTKSIQIVAYNTVLSYGNDWQKCHQSSTLYHIKENFWKGFHWKIDAKAKKAFLVTGGTFCKSGGSVTQLNVGVRVVK